MRPLMEDVNTRQGIFLSLFLDLNKFIKNSTPGGVAHIWQSERVQVDEIKFERTKIPWQTHIISDFFTAVVAVAP